jgi:hypothetical protein
MRLGKEMKRFEGDPDRIPYKFKVKLDGHIKRLFEAGIMMESDTPWVFKLNLSSKSVNLKQKEMNFWYLLQQKGVVPPDGRAHPRLWEYGHMD